MKQYLTLAAALFTAPAWAMDPTASAPAIECPANFGYLTIAEPWEENTATYANGDVRIALVFLVDHHQYMLAVLHPPLNEIGWRQCSLIAADPDTGFTKLLFDEHEASYDPEKGLSIRMPAQLDEDEESWVDMYININQQTGEVRYQVFS